MRPTTGRRALAALCAALITVTAGCGITPKPAAPPTGTPPASVTLLTLQGAPGTYVTDGAGRALYMWDADRAGTPTCYDACAQAWPPLTTTGAATAGPGIDASLIGSVTRKDGTHQVTYGGWPLYYFAPDTKPGQLAGQGDTGFGAVWWVLTPAGRPLPSEVARTTGG